MLRSTLRGAIRSLTIWFNAIAATAMVSIQPIQDALPQLQEYVAPQMYRWLALALVFGNILLRIKTNSSLAGKAP